MDAEELTFLEEQLAATELLSCRECQQLTLHAHREVLATYAQGRAELLMECIHCQTVQVWISA
jgi:hypothetical protein